MTPDDRARQALWAFDAYEAVRHRLPQADFPAAPRHAANLTDLADSYDLFLLDAFGVLNIGETAIAGAPGHIAALQAAGKQVMVLSNAASMPKRVLIAKYARLGFDFTPEAIVSSREVMLAALRGQAPEQALGRIGLMGLARYGTEELDGLDITFLADDPAAYAAADSFVLLGSGDWTPARQSLLEDALGQNPRPVHVGNPDIVAPREAGLSREPGYYAHALADATGVAPVFYGKPFANAFDMALARLPAPPDPARVVMVGDTLHTDILGGAAAGFDTALITGHGALAPIDAADAIRRSGITPTVILPDP